MHCCFRSFLRIFLIVMGMEGEKRHVDSQTFF